MAKQSGITFTGNIIGKLLKFAFLALVTRFVSPDAFGLYTLAVALLTFSGRIVSLSLHQAVDYFVPMRIDEGDYEAAAATFLRVILVTAVTSAVGAVAVAGASGSIATWLDEPGLVRVVPLLAPLILLDAVRNALAALFASIKRMRYRVYMNKLVLPGSQFVLTFAMLFVGWELSALLYGHLLAAGLAIGIATVLAIRRIEWLRLTRKHVDVGELISYSLPLALAGIVYATVAQIDFFVIGYFLDSSNVATYKVGYMLASNLLIFLSSLVPVFKPMIVESIEDRTGLANRYQLATRWIVMMTVPAALTLLLSPETYLVLLFTDQYVGASAVVTVLAAAYLFNVSVGPEGVVLEGLGYTRLTFVNTLVLLSINGVLDVLLVPELGIVGAAIGTGVAFSVTVLLGVGEIYYFENVLPYEKDSLVIWVGAVPSFLAGLLITLVVTHTYVAAVCLPFIVSGTYLLCLRKLGAFTDEDLTIARKIDDKINADLFIRLVGGGSA